MSVNTEYYSGGYIAGKPANNKFRELDSVAATFTQWDTNGVVVTSRALTAAEATMLAAQDAVATSATNQSTIQQRAQQALAVNSTYLGIVTPSTAQTTAQVAALTKQVNGLIRILLSQFDTIAGT